MRALASSDRSRRHIRVVGLLGGFVVLGGLAVAHILAVNREDQYTGVLLILDHLFSLALVLGLFAIAAGVGGRLVKAGGLRMDGPLEALLFRTAAGLGAVATAILGVGLFFSVHPILLFGLLAGAAFLGRKELWELPSLVRGALSCLRARADRFSLVIFLLIALFLITRALAPPADWDALMYHLRVPEQFLREGSIYLPEDNGYVAFVGLPHMLYLPLLALGSPAGPALVSVLCTLGLALAGFECARRFLDDRTAGVSLAVLWGGTILLLVAITPRTDTILAFYIFLVHYAVIRAARSNDPRFLYLGAALGGMAIGIKYNGLLYLLGLAPLGLWILKTRVRARAAALALIVGLALATAFPWLLKNALLLGDPVYPFFGGARLEPWLARIYGGESLPPQVDPGVLKIIWQAQAPFNLVDLLTAPERITVEAEGVSYHANLLLLLLPLWLLFLKKEVLAWLAGPALVYVGLVAYLQPRTSLRYLIPALAPLTLVALHAYALALDKLISRKLVRFLLGATALFVLTDTASLMVRQVTQGRQLAYLAGAVSPRAFLRTWTGGYADVVSFVNERLPEESRVLMLFEARGYYFRVPVLQDNGIINWPLLAGKATAPDCLRSAGITHVLLNHGAVRYYARRGADLKPLRLDAFADFAGDCLTPLYSSEGLTVFQVRDGAAGESVGPVRGKDPPGTS
ncbi:MAG: glycosyltransferase family 39 protein [Gemmatimonadetes bacterium]|nr:glycosyltransferase family 39 protein [Gemmatimonadota bacterium]